MAAMRGSQTSALVLLAALLLAGCGTDSDAARRVVEKIEAPAAGWVSGGPRTSVFEGDVDLKHGIWVIGDYDQDGETDDDPAYLASWEVVVEPGTEQQRCEEAAAWLRKTGEMLPGKNADPGAERPNADTLITKCVRLLKPMPEGSGSSDTGAGGWPGTEKHGYGFFAQLAQATNGSKLSLSVTAEAAPQENFS
jgi:hypothetical protein